MLGKLHGQFFPKVFGETGQEPLNEAIVKDKLTALTEQINQATGQARTPTQVAEGFLTIAVDNMANAIKKISVQRGYDVTEYTLCCFGAAAGQHACLVAEALGIKTILIHPQAGVLSALGMGLADIRARHDQSITAELSDTVIEQCQSILAELETQGRNDLHQQNVPDTLIHIHYQVHLRYEGTDTALLVDFAPLADMKQAFATAHQQRFGFIRDDDTPLVVEAVSVEAIGKMGTDQQPESLSKSNRSDGVTATPIDTVQMVSRDQIHSTPVYSREDLSVGQQICGPAIVVEKTGTTVIEPGWQAEITPRYDIVLTRVTIDNTLSTHQVSTVNDKNAVVSVNPSSVKADPVMLEIFNNLFMSIAEQMGATLANTAYSVNIKERLDFSCAVFDKEGQLIANAPHVPVHLGSMGDSVQTVIEEYRDAMQPGDVFVLNNPYHGGTHLPDVTVVTPVFNKNEGVERQGKGSQILFYVASRGHHADIGGITPGSMPAHSHTLDEEGVVIEVFKLVEKGHLRETEMRALLNKARYPSRHVGQNMADLRAQIAANATGVQELDNMVQHFGLEMVQAYMQHVQDNAEEAVRQLLGVIKPGQFRYEMDNGAAIQVNISIDKQQRRAIIDFNGSSVQQPNNFNAPASVCKAAVLYVFRTLVAEDIPMNAGCLKPLQIIIPERSLLNPTYPAAVVAGNVETSQCITDALYGALGVMAASQGTMNNFTFGNDNYQYYETLCGGSGAGADFHGTSAVHTHMTNSRLTDPEVLEWRFPVLLESFAIRQNSGGTGHYRGGDGVVRRIRFLEAMTASILSGHRRVPPYGMGGGQAGQVGHNWVEHLDGTREILAGTATVEMQAEEVFVIETPGGGGYGKIH
jgi:5-oxoprolinase (ATP-hydrolysing)